MSCIRVDLGADTTAFICSRGKRAPDCAFCKRAKSEFLCDAPLRGKKSGKTCDGKLCASCATLVAPNRHLCPPHRREHEQREKDAVAWLDALARSEEPTPAKPSRDIEEVDRPALDRLFPRWTSPELAVDPAPTAQASGVIDERDLKPENLRLAAEFTSFAAELAAPKPEPERNQHGCVPCARCGGRFVYPTQRRTLKCDDCNIEFVDGMVPCLGCHQLHAYRACMCKQLSCEACCGCSANNPLPEPPRDERRSITEKVAHVRAAKQDRDHACHWPGCTRQCKPAYWGCSTHWYALPANLRDEVWRTYRIGQEQTMTPSAEYVEVARKIDAWIRETFAGGFEQPKATWDHAVSRARQADTRRAPAHLEPIEREHPDPHAEWSWASDMGESEFDPDVGDR